jgi:hypothetical protein
MCGHALAAVSVVMLVFKRRDVRMNDSCRIVFLFLFLILSYWINTGGRWSVENTSEECGVSEDN